MMYSLLSMIDLKCKIIFLNSKKNSKKNWLVMVVHTFIVYTLSVFIGFYSLYTFFPGVLDLVPNCLGQSPAMYVKTYPRSVIGDGWTGPPTPFCRVVNTTNQIDFQI